MMLTRHGTQVGSNLAGNYFDTLINMFFKILPLWEDHEESLPTYMESLQIEMLGFKELIVSVREDASYLSLLSVLQFFIDNSDTDVHVVRREAFRAISLCKKLKKRYGSMEVA